MTVAELQAALERPGANTALTKAPMTTVPTGTGGSVRVTFTPPAQLAAQAGLSREAYALARCIRSEGYGGDPVGRAAAAVVIGQAIRNGSAGKGIEATLTHSQFANASGYFGEQSGRYAATTQDPTAWTGQVAEAVLAGGLPDLARGAHKFLDPAVFARGEQAGRPLGELASVLRSWMLGNEALEWVGPIPTVDTFHLVVLRRGNASLAERQAQREQLLDIYERGKAGDHGPEGGDPDEVPGEGLQALVVLVVLAGLAYLVVNAGWL
jgi:hypothetical protein